MPSIRGKGGGFYDVPCDACGKTTSSGHSWHGDINTPPMCRTTAGVIGCDRDIRLKPKVKCATCSKDTKSPSGRCMECWDRLPNVPTGPFRGPAPQRAIAAKSNGAFTEPEPPCSCPMHVGACVSIGHRAGCAYVAWADRKRKHAAALKNPPPATPPASTIASALTPPSPSPSGAPIGFPLVDAELAHDWLPSGRFAQLHPDFKSWPFVRDNGNGSCHKCLAVRITFSHSKTQNHGTVVVCIPCKTIYTHRR